MDLCPDRFKSQLLPVDQKRGRAGHGSDDYRKSTRFNVVAVATRLSVEVAGTSTPRWTQLKNIRPRSTNQPEEAQ